MIERVKELQQEMLRDQNFRQLCETAGLPWAPEEGYEPRWYTGPASGNVKVLLVMAEPGAISDTEAINLLPAVNSSTSVRWYSNHNLKLNEHYWRANLLTLCESIWPTDTEQCMDEQLGGTCAFWMSLPKGKQTAAVPRRLETYFSEQYFRRLLSLSGNPVIIAAGRKASDRLRRYGVAHLHCWALTKPGSYRKAAKSSWIDTGEKVRRILLSSEGPTTDALA